MSEHKIVIASLGREVSFDPLTDSVYSGTRSVPGRDRTSRTIVVHHGHGIKRTFRSPSDTHPHLEGPDGQRVQLDWGVFMELEKQAKNAGGISPQIAAKAIRDQRRADRAREMRQKQVLMDVDERRRQVEAREATRDRVAEAERLREYREQERMNDRALLDAIEKQRERDEWGY